MKALVVMSGGMDSAVALYHTVNKYGKDNVCSLTFNYGSKHNAQEYQRAIRLCERLGIFLTRIDLEFMNQHFESTLLKSGGKIPDGHYADDNMKQTVVPFRNGIMMSIAAGYAESKGIGKVVLANHFGDHTIYPDCRRNFFEPMREAVKYGTWKAIELESPFCDITKTDIAKLGDNLGVPFEDTYSCYKGGESHCGTCGTCTERKEAFRESGVPDPTIYAD